MGSPLLTKMYPGVPGWGVDARIFFFNASRMFVQKGDFQALFLS